LTGRSFIDIVHRNIVAPHKEIIVMNEKIQESISRIADEARSRYSMLLSQARKQTSYAAGAVSKGKGPLKVVSKLALKLTAVSHKTTDKVLKQQVKLVENQIDAVAGRLRAAATAADLRDLVSTQIRLIPENVSRFTEDARGALLIVSGAGKEVGQLMKGTVAELREPAKAPKAAKKTTRKTAGKKAAGRKSAPRKSVAASADQQAA